MITLSNLPDASAQEVFDQVCEHMLTQKKKCQNDKGTCLYRNGIEGMKCAAGALIAEKEYNFSFDNVGGWSDVVAKGLAPSDHEDLVCELQDIHDHNDVEEWRTALEKLAASYGLKFNAGGAS